MRRDSQALTIMDEKFGQFALLSSGSGKVRDVGGENAETDAGSDTNLSNYIGFKASFANMNLNDDLFSAFFHFFNTSYDFTNENLKNQVVSCVLHCTPSFRYLLECARSLFFIDFRRTPCNGKYFAFEWL